MLYRKWDDIDRNKTAYHLRHVEHSSKSLYDKDEQSESLFLYLPDNNLEEAKQEIEIPNSAEEDKEEVGKILGVPRRTISHWENTSNGHVAKACIPDLRTTTPRIERSKIYKRAKKGESQKGIAADYLPTQGWFSHNSYIFGILSILKQPTSIPFSTKPQMSS